MEGDNGVAVELEKAARVRVRAAGGRWPCKEWKVVESGRINGRI